MPIKTSPKPLLEGGIVDPKEISNHLMPLHSFPKGDLFVRFDIVFPKEIDVGQKMKIVQMLKKNKEETE